VAVETGWGKLDWQQRASDLRSQDSHCHVRCAGGGKAGKASAGELPSNVRSSTWKNIALNQNFYK
jgi:hypothetical protein